MKIVMNFADVEITASEKGWECDELPLLAEIFNLSFGLSEIMGYQPSKAYAMAELAKKETDATIVKVIEEPGDKIIDGVVY